MTRRKFSAICTVEGYGRQTKARGLCFTHLGRLRKFGDVQADKPIRVVNGDGYVHHGYWYVPVAKELRHLTNGERNVAEHRLVMAVSLGRPLQPDESVHHRNGDRLDNRIENLELWTRWQPSGARVEDKTRWAEELLRRYKPEILRRLSDAQVSSQSYLDRDHRQKLGEDGMGA